MKRTSCIALLLGLLLVGCGEDEPEISAETYYELTRVGQWADFTNDDLDNIGRSLCSDMRNLDDDVTRRATWLVVNESADTELQSLGMVLAISARHCPEYFHLWDREVTQINGGELPW